MLDPRVEAQQFTAFTDRPACHPPCRDPGRFHAGRRALVGGLRRPRLAGSTSGVFALALGAACARDKAERFAWLAAFDAFLTRRAADRRLARLTHDMPLPEARGLKFGPGANPTPLPGARRSPPSVTPSTRGPGCPARRRSTMPGRDRAPLAPIVGPDPYDIAIAAQVAQSVPNLLGWLRGIHGVLRAGGVLNLSLPDERFMFDAARPASTLAELVEADLLGLTRPSPRQLFAHASEARAVAPAQIWAGEDPAAAALAHAYAEASAALAAGTYVPCQCWVFTSEGFLDLGAGATRLVLFPFVRNRVGATEVGGFEFYVSMRRDAEEPEALRQLQEGAIDHLGRVLSQQRRTATRLAGR